MKPAKLKKPEHSLDPIDKIGTWIRMEWQDTELWCSEPAKLAFVLEGVPVGAHEAGFVTDATSGDLVAGFGVLAAGDRFEHTTTICDVLPRALPDSSIESSRDLNAKLSNGLCTPKAATLRFLTDLPSMSYEDGHTRFTIRLSGQKILIDHLIPFVRGMMGMTISLGELADEDAGGLLGIKRHGRTDWRYGKYVTVDGNPDRFAYWDGKGWRIAPAEFGKHDNALGEKKDGFALWRNKKGELQQSQKAKFPWPDPVPLEWAPQSLAILDQRIAKMSAAISEFWSQEFDLRRDRCQGYDLHCCRHPIVCDVSLIEVDGRVDHAIVITENDTRANSETWPLIPNSGAASDTTAIHEFGHHLGNPDEYPGASSVDMFVNGDGAIMGIDKDSIMGSGRTRRRRHFDTIAKALAQLVERETGKSFTFTPVKKLP